MPIDQSQILTVRMKDIGNNIKMGFKIEEGEIEGSATTLLSPAPRARVSTPKRSHRGYPGRRRRSSGVSKDARSSLHSSAHRHRRRTSSSTVSGQKNSRRPGLPSSPHRTSPTDLSSLPRSPFDDRPTPLIDSYHPSGNAYAPGDTLARRGVPEFDRWRPAGYGRIPQQRGFQDPDFYRPAPREQVRVEKGGLSWAQMAAQFAASESVPSTKSDPPTKSVSPAKSGPAKKPRSGLFAYDDEES